MDKFKDIKRGNLLIAEPSILDDQEFNRSVILISEHNKNGTVGFILNKPTEHTINELIPEINSDHITYSGGPVAEDNLYFVHTVPELIPNSELISDNIYWAGDFNIVKDLLNEGKINKNQIRFFLGYSGWSNNQLREELAQTSWIVKKNTVKNLFSINTLSFWKKELLKIGGDYKIWANAPKDPKLN